MDDDDYDDDDLTYKVLTTTEPSYLHDLISLQPHRSTRYSDVVTLTPSVFLFCLYLFCLICVTV